jgi:hypothetical protein
MSCPPAGTIRRCDKLRTTGSEKSGYLGVFFERFIERFRRHESGSSVVPHTG